MRRATTFLLALFLVVAPLALVGGSAGATPLFPGVSGGFGTTPKITFPNTSAPSALESRVLVQGSGQAVKKGDLLIANYVGQIWRGKVFDSSFARHQLAAFPIGVNAVIPGWDKTLVGMHWGSRVELVIPPADGYGSAGQSSAGITGKDVLVFVVDVVHSYPANISGDPHATVQKSEVGGITVSGALGKAITLKVAKGTPDPKNLTATLIAKGHGAKVTAGLVVMQFVVISWNNSVVQSTWTAHEPYGQFIGDPSAPTVFDPLVGMPIGSRVLIEIPKTSSGGPYALALDIAAEASGS